MEIVVGLGVALTAVIVAFVMGYGAGHRRGRADEYRRLERRGLLKPEAEGHSLMTRAARWMRR